MTSTRQKPAGRIHKLFRLTKSFVLSTFVVALLISAWILTQFNGTDNTAKGQQPMLAPAQARSNAVYLLALNNNMTSELVAFDRSTGSVRKLFDLAYNARAHVSGNGTIVYVLDQNETQIQAPGLSSSISAYDLIGGRKLWSVDIPAMPFSAFDAEEGLWTSGDGQTIYALVSTDYNTPRVFAIDVNTQRVARDMALPTPYPTNSDNASPRVWKLPWGEVLAVVTRDLLFTFDLKTGASSSPISLFTSDSLQRIPRSLPRTPFVRAGLVDHQKNRLILATSTQEILVVDFTRQPNSIERVIQLPPGVRFATTKPIDFAADTLTLQVAIKTNFEQDRPTAVWIYDVSNWQRVSVIDSTSKSLAADRFRGSGFELRADVKSGIAGTEQDSLTQYMSEKLSYVVLD